MFCRFCCYFSRNHRSRRLSWVASRREWGGGVLWIQIQTRHELHRKRDGTWAGRAMPYGNDVIQLLNGREREGERPSSVLVRLCSDPINVVDLMLNCKLDWWICCAAHIACQICWASNVNHLKFIAGNPKYVYRLMHLESWLNQWSRVDFETEYRRHLVAHWEGFKRIC